MAVRLGINIASIQTQRRLGEHTNELSKVSERLSSGQRINRASDDAAGLAVSSILQSNSRIYSASIRNINDGISAINIADGALASLSDIAIRIAELAEQSANGVYTSKQRIAIDREAQALASEYGRIAEVTSFNGIKLLNGSVDSLDLQVGIDSGVNSRLSVSMPSASSRFVGDGTFYAAGTYSATGDPQSITSGDINNDGIADLMVPNASGAVLTYIGNGDGSFKAPASYSIASGSGGNAAVLADLDNDSDLDMLTLNSVINYSVRLNDGAGNFGADSYYVSGPGGGAFQTRVADMNGDGTLDILSAHNAAGTLRVSIGNGNGTFLAPMTTNLTAPLYTFDTGDVNGDNIQDVIGIANAGNSFHVMLGVGNGTFKAEVTYAPLASAAADSALADINGDGMLDFIAVGGTFIEMRLGNGDGSFKTNTLISGLSNAVAVRAADANGDGTKDLLVADTGNSTIAVLLNNGTGTFSPITTFSTGAAAQSRISMTLADFNEDGVLDIATDGTAASNDIHIFLSNTDTAGGLQPFSLLTQSESRSALNYFNDTINNLAQDRSTLGVGLSRLQVALNNNMTTKENYEAAASRILDADIAHESSELIRLNILRSTASQILEQNNLDARLVLDLI